MANIACKEINLSVPGKHLLVSTDLVITEGSKYAIIGHNGTGKTTLLREIAKKKWSVPEDTDLFYVEQEVRADPDISVFQMVLDANQKRKSLVDRYNRLKIRVEKSDLASEKEFEEYRQTLDELNAIRADRDESIIRYILHGLGFEGGDQDRPTSEFSGGWRMRISLARALYLKPKLLLLDEPTNHLDLNATIWLTSYLCNSWKNTLMVVSHDKNFINDVCDNVIHLHRQKLKYYRGNYDNYLQASNENQRHLDKEWSKIEKRVKEMRKKGIKKIEVTKFLEDNEHLRPEKPYRVRMSFEPVLSIKSPVIKMSGLTFGFDSDRILFNDINLNIDMNTRVAIVGKNGVGKTTLIRTVLGEIKPISGSIEIDRRARIGYYHQHSAEVLPLNDTPVDHLLTLDTTSTDRDDSSKPLGQQGVRRYLGSIGLESKLHNTQINKLSGGQKARVAFASLFIQRPHIIFLDEPTNHLDIETTDALIECINNYDGGVVMITHDIDLIEETDSKLWELELGQINETYYEEYHIKVMNEIDELLE
jgi:ATP-binding cassette, subfamily F, member 1